MSGYIYQFESGSKTYIKLVLRAGYIGIGLISKKFYSRSCVLIHLSCYHNSYQKSPVDHNDWSRSACSLEQKEKRCRPRLCHPSLHSRGWVRRFRRRYRCNRSGATPYHLAEKFNVHHYAVIDLIEEVAKEQDNFDDNVAQLLARLEKLSSKEPSAGSSLFKSTTKQLKHLQKGLSSVSDSVSSLAPEDNVCLFQQHKERLTDMKRELAARRRELLSADSGEIDVSLDAIEQDIFEYSLYVRKLLRSRSASTTSPTPESK